MKNSTTDNNIDIIMKCPQCGVLFHPNKIGQFFCTRDHGWTFRNRRNSRGDNNYTELLNTQFRNLSILSNLQIQNIIYIESGYLESIGFDWDAANPIPNPFGTDSGWYEVFGFLLRRGTKKYMINFPGTTSNILDNTLKRFQSQSSK